MERRAFILSGGALAVAGLAPAAVLAAAAPAKLRRASFAALLNQTLVVNDAVRGVALQVVGIRDGKAVPGLEQFAVLLSGTDTLKPGIVQVYHASLGTLQLFLEASGARGAESLYRIQFSLLTA